MTGPLQLLILLLLLVDDKNITLASGSANAAAASGAGFTVDIGTGTLPAITYDGTNDEWDFNKSLNVQTNLLLSSDGSNSIISEAGSGSLLLRASTFAVQDTSNINMIQASPSSGSVSLYYNNGSTGALKLATTSTGIDVTGTITADGLTVDAALATINAPSNNADFILSEGGTNTDARIRNSNGILEIDADLNNEYGNSSIIFAVDGTDKLKINNNGEFTLSSAGTVTLKAAPLGSTYGSGFNVMTVTGTSSSPYTSTIGFNNYGVTDAMVIKGGNVGIGTASPAQKLQVSGALVSTDQLTSPGSAGSYTYNATALDYSSNGARLWSWGSSTARGTFNFIQLENDGTNQQTAMSIDSSGNLLIGKTADDATTDGIQARGLGSISIARSSVAGDPLLVLNKKTNDGTIAEFRKDGTAVGSIGTANSGDLYIGNDDTTLLFAGGSDAIIPRGTAGAARNGAIDLGLSAHRFKDLYLSGTAQADTYQFAQNSSAVGATEAIYRPTTGQIAFKANSTERMRIDSSGNVGIGTNDPDTLLEIRKDTSSGSYGAYPTLSIRNDNATGYGAIHFQEGSTQRARIEVSNNSGSPYLGLHIGSGADGIRITSAGKVGIGTTDPGKLLTLSRATEAQNEQLEFRNVGGISNGNFDGIKWTQGATGGTMLAEQRINYYTTGVVDMSFNLRNEDNVLYLKAGGNVGIGHSSPYFPLHVHGPTGFNGEAKNNILAFDSASATTGTGGGIAFGGYSNGTGGDIYHFGNIQGIKENSTAGNYASAMLFSTRANGATPKVQMRISSTGNVGIGTNDPGALLDLETPGNTADGTFYSTITINNTGTNTFSGVRLDRSDVAKWRVGLMTDDKFHIANLFTGGSASNPNDDAFVIDNNSNIGINTAPSSSYKLNVNGETKTLGLYSAGTTNLGTNGGSNVSDKTILAGYGVLAGNGVRYGNYGSLIFRSSSGYTAGARSFLITNGYDANKFAIIQSSTHTTIPDIDGAGGGANNGTPRFVISSAGNVGIGTAAPDYPFHVGSTTTNVAVFDSSNDSGTYVWIRNSDAVTGRQANLGFAPANNIEGARISAVATEDFSSSANRTADLAFWTRLNGTMKEQMRVTSEGETRRNYSNNTSNSKKWWSTSSTNFGEVYEYDYGNNLYFKKTRSVDGYSQVLLHNRYMPNQYDVSFELTSNADSGTYRHFGIALNHVGTENSSTFDYLVLREHPTASSNNQVRLDLTTGTVGNNQGSGVPAFHDGTKRKILIQKRSNTLRMQVHELNGTVFTYGTVTGISWTNTSGYFGFIIYESTTSNTFAEISNLTFYDVIA